VNRLLSKLRHAARNEGTTGSGVSHVQIVGSDRRPRSRRAYVLTAAETAPCTCPEFCERDHGNE
jgi:hypothetical protein